MNDHSGNLDPFLDEEMLDPAETGHSFDDVAIDAALLLVDARNGDTSPFAEDKMQTSAQGPKLAGEAKAKGAINEVTASIAGQRVRLKLTNNEYSLLRVMGTLPINFSRRDVFETEFLEHLALISREAAFPITMSSLLKKIALSAEQKVIEPTGERGSRRYTRLLDIEDIEIKEASEPTKQAASQSTTELSTKPVEDEVDEDTDERPIANAGLLGELILTDRVQAPDLKEAARQAMSGQPHTNKTRGARSFASTPPALAVIDLHFGSRSLSILEIADELGMTPYTTKNFIREQLKASDTPQALAYLEFLDDN